MDAIGRKKGVDMALEPLEMHWRNLFKRYDLDNDGQIEVNEFIERIRNDTSGDIPPRVLRHLQNLVRKGGRSVITYPEFIKLINERNPQNAFQKALFAYTRHMVVQRVKGTDITDGEYEDEYTCSPPAVCMLIVSIVEVFLFIIDSFKTMPGSAATLLWYNPHRRAEFWRFLTYMFVHMGPGHLLVNVIVQILLGVPLEMVHRWWRVLLVYLAGVLAGSMGTTVSDPNVYLAGASGGVYALITAHIATIILNWSEMRFAIGQLLIFIVLICVDTGTAIYNRYTSGDNKIGYAAHFAGAIAGLLVGLYILRNLAVHSWEKMLSRAAVIIYLVLMIAIIIFNIAYPDYFPYQETTVFSFGDSGKLDVNNNSN